MRKKDPDSLNKREKAILKFIEKQINANGYPPSVREIGKAVGLKSTATVHGYLAALEEKGYIIQYINESIVCISFENATKGKALKNKHFVLKNQYIELMYLIEARKAKQYNYLKVYSKGKYIIADIISILKRLGYRVTQNIVIINDEQWCEVEIMWK